MKKRILSLVLAVSLCTSLLVAPAYAAPALPGEVTTPAQSALGVSDLKSLVNTLNRMIDQVIADSTLVAGSYWTTNPPVGYIYCTYDSMCSFASVLNTQFNDKNWFFYVTKLPDSDFHAIRLLRMSINKNPTESLWYLADHDGYMLVSMPGDGVPNAPTTPSTTVQAIPRSQAAAVGAYRMLSYEDLYNLAYDYNNQHNYKLALNTDGTYWAISPRGDYVLANESGLPYGAVGPLSVTSGGNSRPDAETGEEQLIDWSGGTVINENGDTIDYDGCIFDSSTKTYYIDNHTENYYYTYNYYIEKTYITYIGSSAEYTETYERYYELPDGRSSADLTKEDLEQLNLSMDVVEYQRSADDTRLRSLYHFDGNTEDASYWNYATSFDWTTGASLTYLESNAFNGCLYLDELAHDFTITLPSSLGSGDFTVDFRYYQAYTGTPQNDSYISIGGQEVLRLTGSNFVFNGTNYSTPVGNWNHLAFVRKDGTLYFYLNGVRQGSKGFSNVLSSAVQFSFGSSQQTYKYLDELRVTNFAVWESNFTPATVPYDTNLSLVLPTDTLPVADEYWDISMTGTNLLSPYHLDWWDGRLSSGVFSSYFQYNPSDTSLKQFQSVQYPTLLANDGLYNTWSTIPYSLSINSNDYTSISEYPFSGYPYIGKNSDDSNLYLPHGFVSVLGRKTYSLVDQYLSYGTYTLSMVSLNGDIGYFTFTVSDPTSIGEVSYSFNGYTFRIRSIGNYPQYYSYLQMYPTSSNGGKFIYLALERGTESTVTAEFVSGIAGIPADDLNTPTLAVRSDIPMPVSSGSFGGGREGSESTSGFNNLKSYQIGGVRPTFAERGYVYAMVESGYITSLQQYTGYAWQAVDGRIWTGSRWIPYSSYNVITLSDMYDISDASGQGGYEYIYSQSGFWSWWQKQWLEFKQWYSNLSFTGGGGGDTVIEGDTINNDYDVDIDFGTARSNSVGLLQFIQTVFGDLTSGFANFTSLYTSPDDSLDVLFPTSSTDE